MTTTVLGTNINSTDLTEAVTIEAGVYMVGASTSDDATVNLQLFANIGPAVDVRINSVPLDMSQAQIVFLPTCSLRVSVGNLGRLGGANVAITRLGDIVGHVQEQVAFPGPIDGPIPE